MSNSATSIRICIGDRVQISTPNKEISDPEDFYYLKSFENKVGVITEKNKIQSGYNYRVEFGSEKDFGYFYENDLTLLAGD